MKAKFIYSDQYDFKLFGFEKLHAFDAQKFSKAWKLFASGIEDINECWIKPINPVSDDQLLQVHTQEYLDSLKDSQTIAWVVEVSLAKYIPNSVLQTRLIDPLRLATTGTLLATKAALDSEGVAMNFGGGYHHAFKDHGEGFCFFADAALAIQQSRLNGDLKCNDAIIMIDLDAHQANGFHSFFHDDPNVHLYDVYNVNAYPRGFHDEGDPEEFPVRNGESGEDYLTSLYKELPTFIDANQKPALAIYNAGSDILSGDKIGGLNVSYEDIVKRDVFVLEQLISRGIPTVILTSGGYTKDSHKLVAELARIVNKLTA